MDFVRKHKQQQLPALVSLLNETGKLPSDRVLQNADVQDKLPMVQYAERALAAIKLLRKKEEATLAQAIGGLNLLV